MQKLRSGLIVIFLTSGEKPITKETYFVFLSDGLSIRLKILASEDNLRVMTFERRPGGDQGAMDQRQCADNAVGIRWA